MIKRQIKKVEPSASLRINENKHEVNRYSQLLNPKLLHEQTEKKKLLEHLQITSFQNPQKAMPF